MAAAWLLTLGGCSQPTHDVLCFGLASAPVTLDPRFATDAASSRINRLLYRRLVDFDEAARPMPSLATWEVISPRHYRFTLGKEGREFHNGSRLTARDVKATYDFILDAKNASPHRATLAMIADIKAPDDDTIDFYLNKPDALFPGMLAIGIVPERLIAAGHPLGQKPVGSGSFEFAAWPAEGRLRLVRTADRQTLEFLHVPDPTVRALKLMRGEIDMLQNDLPPELVKYLEARKDLQVRRGSGSNFSYLGFNMSDPMMRRLEVRRAIAYALDRRAIIRHVLGGAARPAGAMFPPDHWAGLRDLSGYPHDPRRARALLKEAGFDERHPVHITYKTSSDPFRIRLATIIQSQLAEVGIRVDLRSYDWGTFYGDIKAGRFQMFSLSWVGVKTPDIFRYAFHSTSAPPEGANRGRFASPVIDHLIEAAEAEPQPLAQAVKYQEIQRHLLEELPYVPLWYEDHVFVARRDVMGYALATDGDYDGLIRVSRRGRHEGGASG
ncbi:MAG: ABC transporter substrate-binding protein [Gammaproteobacteria bacterium]|nr:ABC transporter substrate-binding protein [Gammaproteobacteria bacterium]